MWGYGFKIGLQLEAGGILENHCLSQTKAIHVKGIFLPESVRLCPKCYKSRDLVRLRSNLRELVRLRFAIRIENHKSLAIRRARRCDSHLVCAF